MNETSPDFWFRQLKFLRRPCVGFGSHWKKIKKVMSGTPFCLGLVYLEVARHQFLLLLHFCYYLTFLKWYFRSPHQSFLLQLVALTYLPLNYFSFGVVSHVKTSLSYK